MWFDVYKDFSELSKLEQLSLFEAIKKDLFPEEQQSSKWLDGTL